VLVCAFYAAQIAIVAWRFGWLVALAYATSLPVSATWDFRYADRVRRGVARVWMYFRLRRNPELHHRLRAELDWLRNEAIELNALVGETGTTLTRADVYRHVAEHARGSA
jgi:hypothetical protein